MKRHTHIDTMKAIGIVLVVVGHAPGLDPAIKQLIYSFHMPLFFFISGMLLSESKLFMPFGTYFGTVWRTLGVPYVLFFLVSYLYWLPTHELASRSALYSGIRWWDPLLGVVIGNGDALYVNVVLWFFTCLISASLLFHVLRRHFSAIFLLVTLNGLAFAYVLAYQPGWPRLPWGIDNAVVALAFFAAGHYFRGHHDALRTNTPVRRAALIAILAFAVLAPIARINGVVDLNTLQFGRSPVLYFGAAYLGIAALFYLSLSVRTTPVLTWLSKNTLIIFPTHLLMFSIFTGVGVVVFGLPHDFKTSSVIWTVAFPTLALLLSYPAARLAQWTLPAVFGAPRPRIALEGRMP